LVPPKRSYIDAFIGGAGASSSLLQEVKVADAIISTLSVILEKFFIIKILKG
jgi:hypothetical protein